VTRYRYEERGLVASREDADGAVWRFEHGAGGMLRSVTDPLGAMTSFEYGPHGELTRTTDPLGRSVDRTFWMSSSGFPVLRGLCINWLYSVGVGFTIAYLLERRRDRGGKGVAPAGRVNYVLVPDGTRVRRLPLGEFVGLVRGLDGQKRSLVSAVRRGARLDVVGDASGAMVVWFSPDVKDEGVWSFLASPVAGTVFRLPPGEGEELVRVSVDGVEGEYARWETTTLTSAVGAAEQFVKDGTAKEGLVWFASPDVFERRPLR